MPFNYDRSERNTIGNVEIWFWQKGDKLNRTSLYEQQDSAAAIVAGYGMSRDTGDPLGAAELLHGKFTDIWNDYNGEWSGVLASEQRVVAGSSAIGTQMLFVLDQPELIALSNRGRLLWEVLRALDRPLIPNQDTLATLITRTFPYCTDGTAVQDVRFVASDKYLEIKTSTGKVEEHELDPLFFLNRNPAGGQDWDRLAQTLSKNTRWLEGAKGPVIGALTGGKDSRLVLSMLDNAGLIDKVDKFMIRAPQEHGDVASASMIAKQKGLDFERQDLGDEYDLMGSIERHVLVTEGSLNAWDLKVSTNDETQIRINGLGGELYRRASLGIGPLPDSPLGRIGETFRKMRPSAVGPSARVYVQDWDNFGWLLPWDLFYSQRRRAEQWLEDLRQRGLDAGHFIDALYLRQTLPRWGGHAKLHNDLIGVDFNPLFNIDLVRAYQQLSLDDRSQERVHFEMMVRLDPELATLPFNSARWDARMIARSTFPDLRVAEKGLHNPCVGAGWQVTAIRRCWPQVRKLIENERLLDSIRPQRVGLLLDVAETVLGIEGADHSYLKLKAPFLLITSQRNVKRMLQQVLGLLTIQQTVAMLEKLSAT
ncbi:MAG: hypothetical protein P9M14_04245 [Candidatus Alcyoniella australis]|nr:hypothetical protein [Candidatus Alcyoniella australis]